jgi:ABC-type antimicrobial peptide transport system permease subunit
MTISQFLRIFNRNLKWLIIFPFLVALLVYFLTAKMPKEFESNTSIYTGFALFFMVINTAENTVNYPVELSDFARTINYYGKIGFS